MTRHAPDPPRPCIILVRNPGAVVLSVSAITEALGDLIHIFKDADEAVAFAAHNSVCQAWPYQIVSLEELL